MQETLRHIEAFEYYYGLGAKRSLVEVGQKFGVSSVSAEKWSVAFEWQRRVQERDQKNAQALAQQTDKLILKTRADYRKEIQQTYSVVRAALVPIIEALKNQTVKAETLQDLTALVASLEKLIKLDLTVTGEGGEEGEPVKFIRFSFAPPPGVFPPATSKPEKPQNRGQNGV
jgi:hypothetical protein